MQAVREIINNPIAAKAIGINSSDLLLIPTGKKGFIDFNLVLDIEKIKMLHWHRGIFVVEKH